MAPIPHSDLILDPDGRVYHLKLHPGEIAGTILLVGDPGRVAQVSSRFDSLEVHRENREFVTHTGLIGQQRMSVISTGIGTDNIDIVLNELDALVNIDLRRREPTTGSHSLRLVRLGTCGALQDAVKPGSFVLSAMGGGLDGLYHFYQDPRGVADTDLSRAFSEQTGWGPPLPQPYFIKGSPGMLDLLRPVADHVGITLSTPGFYAPQSRSLRLRSGFPASLETLTAFRGQGMKILNFEMECSGIFALSELMGHRAATICLAIANRVTGEVLADYSSRMDSLIRTVLETLAHDEQS